MIFNTCKAVTTVYFTHTQMRMHTVHINRVRADTSLARCSALVKQCGLAGPRLASFRGQLDMLGIEALAAVAECADARRHSSQSLRHKLPL